jgi:hypothetical protein
MFVFKEDVADCMSLKEANIDLWEDLAKISIVEGFFAMLECKNIFHVLLCDNDGSS